jgi:glycosyltransferase involved in cell wall biosynthesis
VTVPVRVLFLAHAFPRAAGDLPGNFVLRLAAALAAEGVAVTALAPAADGVVRHERLDGVEVHRYRYAPARLETLAYSGGMHVRAASGGGAVATGGLLTAGSLAAWRHGRGADLLHAHWWVPGGLQALASGRRPLVTTLHGTDLRLALRNPLARAACARVLRASALVTTVSTWLRDRAAQVAPAVAARLRVAPMPVDEAVFQPPPAGAPRDELLFVGRLDAQKGLADALRALPRLTGRAAGLPLRVIGHGPELAALQRLAGQLGIAARVRWEPYVPLAELAGRYRRAAALLVPSRAEGLGLVAVEAQLSATPVVAAAAGGLVDVVADGRTGRTFPPGEPAALATAVSGLLDDPAGAAALAERARQAALERFSRRAAARAYAAAYREALDARARDGRRRGR